jgi:hypothetical protein
MPSGPSAVSRPLSKDQVSALENEANRLETIISSQSANGLFRSKALEDAKTGSEDCYAFVRMAREAIRNEPVTFQDLISAKNALDSGWERIDEAIETAGFSYKFQYIYGAPTFVIMLAYFSFLIVGAIRFANIQIFGLLPSAVLIAGSMGALLRWMWGLISCLLDREFVKNWITPVALAPFVGALLGLGVYAAYYFVSAAAGRPPQAFDISSLLLSLIAGYGWRETMQLLSKFTRATIGSILTKS